jgi:hypothetical protein
MRIASHVRRMIRLFLRREPSTDETRVFTALAADAASLGALLRRNQRIVLDQGSGVDLADGNEREILAAALRAGTAMHLRGGEDMLTLLERLNRMIEASNPRRDGSPRADLGISLLRAIAIVELLDAEARERFPTSQPLAKLAADSARALAQGFVAAMGTEVPADLKRAFPRFARTVRDAAEGRQTDTTPSLMQRLALGMRRAPEPETDPQRSPKRLDATSAV